MKIIVDREICIGAASCVALAPKTFALDTEGKVFILNEEHQTESEQTEVMDARETIVEAARSCPVFAIKLFEDDGTEIVL